MFVCCGCVWRPREWEAAGGESTRLLVWCVVVGVSAWCVVVGMSAWGVVVGVSAWGVVSVNA